MEIKGEKAFPRGGKKAALFKSNKNSSFTLFKNPKAKLKKKDKKVKQFEKTQTGTKSLTKKNKPLEVRFVEQLTPSVVQDEMLLLGVVSQVTGKFVNVSLPGGLKGAISLPHVSEFYTNIIENSPTNLEIPNLKEMFQPDDILPVKVISVSEKHSCIMLSSDPKLINSKISYSVIEKGFVLLGSVKSKEDHGFVIDFGIQQVNGFMNFSKIDPNRNLKVGQLVRCAVVSCNMSSGSCSVQLSSLSEDLHSSFISKFSSLPLYCFVPGMQFEVIFKKILKNGLEVSYSSSTKGFIHEDHLLKNFSDLTAEKLESKAIATLLYVKPFVNFPHFKIFPKKLPDWPFEFGQIVEGKVVKTRSSGVIAKVVDGGKTAKCFIPVSKLKDAAKIIENKLEIFSLYPLNKTLKKVRLGQKNYMDRYYLGAADKASIAEKYYSVFDLKPGEIVTCSISEINNSRAQLRIGKTITGEVGFTDMTDTPLKNPAAKFKVGQKVKARVLDIDPETRFVRLTMKPTLLKETEILCSCNDVKKNKHYFGTVLLVMNNKLVVKFFNDIRGMVPKHLTPYPDAQSLKEHFNKGELVKCSVTGSKNNKLCLSMVSNDSNIQLKVGKKYSAEVINKTQSGLFVEVLVEKNKKCKAYLPAELLTAHRSLLSAFHLTYSTGEKLFAYCVFNDLKSNLPILGATEVFQDLYEGKTQTDFENLLKVNSIVPFLFKFKSSKTNKVYLHNVLPTKENKMVKVIRDDFHKLGFGKLSQHQLIMGKILSIKENRINVSITLADVWDKDFHSSLCFLNSYLMATNKLIRRQKNLFNTYSKDVNVGSSVKGTIEEVRSKSAVVRTENGDLGIAQGKFSKGQEINGRVVWIDPVEQILYIKGKDGSAEERTGKGPRFNPDNDFLRSKVAHVNADVAVVELKGRGNDELAFLPRRRHLNDFEINECILNVGQDLRVWVTRKDSNFLLGMDQRILLLKMKISNKKSENKLDQSIQTLKRKLESEKIDRRKKLRNESESIQDDDIEVVDVKLNNRNTKKRIEGTKEGVTSEVPEVKEEIDVDDEMFNTTGDDVPKLEYDDLDIKTEDEDEEQEEQKRSLVFNGNKNNEKIILSSSSESENEEDACEKKNSSTNPFNVGFNWDVLYNHSLLSGVVLNKEESSDDNDDDEDDESKNEKKKRRRLTASEKKEQAKSEEERLRFIEERLMNADREPETADDFDRALLSNPDSSALWLKYMAFHMQGTEIDKARAVAQRALKSISFRKEQEKLNIWIAFLNLENLYGNEDSLTRILNEALRANEPYRIHLHMLNLHGQGNKLQEMEKLGNLMLKKYKELENMWYEVATAYYAVGKVESGRNVLQKALVSLNKNKHVPLISRFAHLENKYGSQERAQTLYESILSSFPKRVDVWCSYVNMLVKSNHIDLARKVLERATSQTLRPRKMKTLFKKFLSFEEAHGTPEMVEKVREAAVEYVQTVGAADYK